VDVVLLSSVAILSPNPSIINSSYLRYYLDSSVTRSYLKASFISGAAIPRIVLKDLKRAAIRVPPMPIQIRIAGILSAYDELIENNQRRIKILEEMARSLYREWFVHFRYPGHETVPLVDSPLGPIPQGWEVKPLGRVADVKWGDTSTTKKSYVDEGYLAYSAAGSDGKLDHYDFDRAGIVLSAIGANCGLTWFAQGKWSCIKNTIRFWSSDSRISTEYLFYASLGKDFWPKRGAAQPFISQGDAKNIPILIPSQDIVDQFETIAANTLRQGAILSDKNKSLSMSRNLLLPKLLSDQVNLDGMKDTDSRAAQ